MRVKGKDGGFIKYYAISQTLKCKTGKAILLHRFIMNAPDGMVVDHIDRNEQNTLKNNLRVCTQQGNVRNQSLSVANKSGHKGVRWADAIPTPKWNAYIEINHKNKNLGYFTSFEDACRCREEAELKYFGKYSTLYDDTK